MTQSSLLSSSLSSPPPSSSPPLSSNARRKRPLWTPPSTPKGKRIRQPVEDIDVISNLPDELLEKILSMVPLRSAVKTSVLSKRWEHLWKRRLHLCLDMRFIMETTPTKDVHEVSRCLAESMTKTINNHRGHLDSCTICHFLVQCEDGTLERWIRTMTRVKHTKELTLVNYLGCVGPLGEYNSLQLAPSTFSHHSLTSLSLTRYTLTQTKAFKSCYLKTLKLQDIIADIGVLNRVFTACSSLEVLVLQITSLRRGRGVLKIKNKKLEVLQVSCPSRIKNMEVHAPSLVILDIRYIYCDIYNFILEAPKIRFNRNYWVGGKVSHISYNISSLSQEKREIWHELMVSQFYERRRTGSLSVSIDAKNPKEVEILKEVLLLWGREMIELEIIFKNNNAPSEEGESFTNGGVYKKWWDRGAKPFPDAFFQAYTIWIYNFSGSNEEEFALLARFVIQGTVIDKLMIETSTYPPMKKFMTETKVAKLMKLSEGNDDFTIECF